MSLLESQRMRARGRLPSPIFHYVDGGSDDERTLRANVEVFQAYQFVPPVLMNAGTPDTSCQLFGETVDLPLVLAPAAALQLLHPGKELAVAAAAASARVPMVCAMLGNTAVRELTAAHSQMIAQVYLHRDRGLNDAFVDLCKAANVKALCVTVDAFVPGNRERDKATGMTMPLRWTAANALELATHLSWLIGQTRAGRFGYPNIKGGGQQPKSVAQYIASALNPSPSWDDLERIRLRWKGPLAVKGILCPDDARRATSLGVSTIFISNHGGRQLDSTTPALSQLEPIRDAVGPNIDLIVDGGVRRGTDILKAIALGANACSIGRPYLFALAAGGEKAVSQLLSEFREEVERDMALLGCRNLEALTPKHLRTVESRAAPAKPRLSLA